ncbi:uncharacterized protein Z520_08732 [Fonsecaea multimorphosa CBS 102226]|uniref:Uncharacterized protein n=1 Tax=Fonsecaea multimorphosa CBS 102226 TaxID=1442371 RepID=A0A0D2JQH7_9EURO|nr:uncharacterized protein Z520_08732 [Fonsecaea multimorphosa CBS 102226]KIX95612.1 hypothetical protein Z520_08732 [Fonsecaea multimorphosa CBS 102226]OAL21216.1 hypothetical protein AYO22_08179 [Fonsecaea multimorphosa]
MRTDPRRKSTGNGAFLISSSRSQSTAKMDRVLPPRPRNPALYRLYKFRTILLPILLALDFSTLILAAIYAYCVAKPYTNVVAGANSSIFGKRETAPYASSTAPSTGNTSIYAAETQPETALLFYALTAGGLSLTHLVLELTMHHNTPRLLSLRKAYIILLATSSLLICGWITSLSFWMHCELPIFNQNISGQAVCPVQVRGHFMYGIHEVSIARIVVGWVVVMMYVAHVVLMVMGWRAQRRIWRIIGPQKGDGDVEMTHGEARVVVVRFGEDVKEADEGSGKETTVV